MEQRRALSRDYSWFSPILNDKLSGVVADAVVWVESSEEMETVLRIAVENRIPLTARGGGTGNYAQSVPLYGGIVADTTRMNKKLEITEQGFAVADPGVRLKEIRDKAESMGYSLRVFPSTYVTATLGGYLCGGSAGVGSVQYGDLWNGNVSSVQMLTPALGSVEVSGRKLDGVIHAAGTTGLLTKATIPLTKEESFGGLICSFASLREALAFGKKVASSSQFRKRIVMLLEPKLASLFTNFKFPFDERGYNVMLVYSSANEAVVRQTLRENAPPPLHSTWIDESLANRLTDITFNHTTLWAKREEQNLTWADLVFDLDRAEELITKIKGKLGESFLLHVEYALWRNQMVAWAFPLLYYKSMEDVQRILDYFNQIGVSRHDVHTVYVDDRLEPEKVATIVQMKHAYDPHGILNPGKIRAFQPR